MVISIIVAVAENNVIGSSGRLAWQLPAELAHFKRTTIGHPIIMGRKTYESIGHALPGRINIVITHDTAYQAIGCKVVHSLREALKEVHGVKEVFIIGGATLYEQTLPIASQIYLTKIHATPKGDTFFHYDPKQWQIIEQEKHQPDQNNTYAYTFLRLVR